MLGIDAQRIEQGVVCLVAEALARGMGERDAHEMARAGGVFEVVSRGVVER